MNANEKYPPHPQVARKAAEVAEFVRQIQSGDASVFQALYDATEQYVYFCVSGQGVPETDVADVMQEVYLAVYRDLYTIKEPQAALGWIKRVAFHKSMDYFRRMGKAVLTETDTETVSYGQEETLRMPEDVMEREESGRLIRELIGELPEEYRRVLILHYFLECSVAEIARETGVPEGTVKTRLYRARKELGESIETLEKQQGIRLHSVLLVPALGLLFHSEAQAAQIPAALHAAVTETLAQAAGAAAGNGGAVTAGVLAGNGKASAGLAAKKWIAAAVASLCVGGGAALFLWLGGDDTNPVRVAENETSSESGAGQNGTVSTPQATAATQPSATPEPTSEPVDKTELFAAYKKLFEGIQAERAWPDGSPLHISGDLGEALQYAVEDLDGDGNEELVVSVVTADYMAAYMENMYKYDPAAQACVQASSMYPSPGYYDNGMISGAVDNSQRFTSSIRSYNKESGVYEEIANAKLVYRSDAELAGLEFPAEADKDGDGSLWEIHEGEKVAYLDNEEEKAWMQEKIGTGKQVKVKWIPFSEGWKY